MTPIEFWTRVFEQAGLTHPLAWESSCLVWCTVVSVFMFGAGWIARMMLDRTGGR
jgi:hypothetical protein